MAISMKFINDLTKRVEKLDNVTTDFSPPSIWYNTGNLALNKIMSGSFTRGIPQGRISILAGPSGSGKTFLGCNILKNAQDEGAFILALDSENALDVDFMSAIGVDTSSEKFMYFGVVTISDVVSVLSEFITGYEKEYGRHNAEAPKVVIFLDSLDMLLTTAENDNFDKGEQKGDQGQRAKQMKHMLRTVVSRISRLNITFIATHQVYPADVMLGEGAWAINNAVRYSASQIILVTKLKLKEDTEVVGIRMRAETFKSRFAKLGSKIEIEVPYAAGMNPFSGLLEMFEADGVVTKAGAWYTTTINDEIVKFQKKMLNKELVDKLLAHPILANQELVVSKLLATPELVEEVA
jgi:recombination protein RecA